jgi:hypothetical protein
MGKGEVLWGRGTFVYKSPLPHAPTLQKTFLCPGGARGGGVCLKPRAGVKAAEPFYFEFVVAREQPRAVQA